MGNPIPLAVFAGMYDMPLTDIEARFEFERIAFGTHGHYVRKLKIGQGAIIEDGRHVLVRGGLFSPEGQLVELHADMNPKPGDLFQVDFGKQRQMVVYPLSDEHGRAKSHAVCGAPQDFDYEHPFDGEPFGDNNQFRARRMAENYAVNRRLSGILLTHNNCHTSAQNKPLYLVAAGPSLERNVGELAKVKKGLVIAINGALPVMQPHRLPDVFWSLDYKCREHWFRDVPVDRIDAVLTYGTNPIATQQRWRRRYWCNLASPEPVARQIYADHPEILHLSIGLSSTYSCLHWAYLCGFNPIILVGCDHAQTDDGLHHAGDRHTTWGLIKQWFRHRTSGPEPILLGEGWEGRNYRTTVDLIQQAMMLHGIIDWISRDRLVINATEGGILKCPAQAKLSEVVERLEDADISRNPERN